MPASTVPSDDTVQRYYYIYDSRQSRTLVMDRTTGEEFLWENDARTPLLEHVASTCSPRAMREFATWCVHRVMEDDARDGPAWRLLQVADQMVQEKQPESLIEPVRAATVDDVVHAATIGLSRMDPVAARLLTAQSATHPDARRAALDAAHMAERYAEFVAFRQHEMLGSHTDALKPDAAARHMRQRQIDELLDRLLRDRG